MHQILFIQGGGEGAHDEWDDKLVASLKRQLGTAYKIVYPHMPDEGDPSYSKWKPAITREIAALDDGAVLVGHSIGATMMISALAEYPLEKKLGAIMLLSAPFVGEGGWIDEEFQMPGNLGAKLPKGVPVHIFHGTADEIAPPVHSELYAGAIPQARLHRLSGRDHQLNNDLIEVARALKALAR